MDTIHKDEVFMIPGIGGRKPMEVTKSYLCRIIQPRLEEILEFAFSEIKRSGYAGSLGAGVVITGGTALIRGVEELATEIFSMPVKIGMPKGISYTGLVPEITSPVYSTAVGLALYGIDSNENMKNYRKTYKSDGETIKQHDYQEEKPQQRKKEKEPKQKDSEGSFLKKAKDFFDKL